MREIGAVAPVLLLVRCTTVVLRRRTSPVEPTGYTVTEPTATACPSRHTMESKLAMHIATLAGTAALDGSDAYPPHFVRRAGSNPGTLIFLGAREAREISAEGIMANDGCVLVARRAGLKRRIRSARIVCFGLRAERQQYDDAKKKVLASLIRLAV